MKAELTLTQKFHELKGRYQFFKFINNPYNTPSIFNMTDSFQKAAPESMVKKLLEPLVNNTNLEDDYLNKVWHHHPKPSELENYPKGTFGHEVFLFFKNNNLDEDLFPEPDYTSLVTYITSRVYQTHDFWHVLTGYSTSLEDEMALQAFGVGQYKQPISLMIIAGGIIHIMQKSPEKAFELLNRINEGYNRGLHSKMLLDINIFDYLKMDLHEVRKELGLV